MLANKHEKLTKSMSFSLTNSEKEILDNHFQSIRERSRSNGIRKILLEHIQCPTQQAANPQPIPTVAKSSHALELSDKDMANIHNYMHDRGLDCPVEAARELLSIAFSYIEEQQGLSENQDEKENNDELFTR